MKHILTFLLSFITLFAFCSNLNSPAPAPAKAAAPLTEFLDEVYDFAVKSDIVYTDDDYTLDLYYPTTNGSWNPGTNGRPVYIHVHGGAWLDTSYKTNSDTQYICERMAKRGYHALAIEYPRYSTSPTSNTLRIASGKYLEAALAFVNGISNGHPLIDDGIGQVRYFDQNSVLMGGESAGAFMVFGRYFDPDTFSDTSNWEPTWAGSTPADIDGALLLWGPYKWLAGDNFDVYPYSSNVPSTSYYVFLAHGTNDSQVAYNHSTGLNSNLGNPNLYGITNADHTAWFEDFGHNPPNYLGFYGSSGIDAAWYTWAKNKAGR